MGRAAPFATRLAMFLVLVVFVFACSDDDPNSAPTTNDLTTSTLPVEPTSDPAGDGATALPADADTLDGRWAKVPTALGGSELVPLLVPFEERLFVLYTQNGGREVAGEIYDPATDTAVLMADSDQVWRYNPAVAWTGTELLMVGGSNGPGIDDQALAYDPTSDQWRTLRAPPEDFGARGNSITGPGFWTGRELILWQNALALDPETETWRALAVFPGTPRAFPAVVWTNGELMVWGGCDISIPQCDDAGTGRLTDGAIYNVDTDTWRSMAPSPLAPGVHPKGVLAGDGILLYAGKTEPAANGAQAAQYDSDTDTWFALAGLPIEPRRYAAAAWTGRHFVLWGGEQNGETWYDDGAAFDPQTGQWTALPEPPPRSARDRHAMAWIADRLYIVGGWQTNGPLTFTPT